MVVGQVQLEDICNLAVEVFLAESCANVVTERVLPVETFYKLFE